MIAVDTNVLIRYIMDDDAKQSPLATHLIDTVCSKESPALICHLVLCETMWVLRSSYLYGREHLIPLLKQILNTENFEIQQSHLVWQAVYDYEAGNADFSDYLLAHVNRSLGAGCTYSFDKKALKHKHFKAVEF